jgi:hypothetical protein
MREIDKNKGINGYDNTKLPCHIGLETLDTSSGLKGTFVQNVPRTNSYCWTKVAG